MAPPTADAAPIDLEACLSRFGLSGFRPGQKEVISAVMAGQDCLCVMPTGGGKSLCYQLPAVARPGLALVVSPLIALMKDQVDQLTALGLRATFINSTLAAPEQYARLEHMAAGHYDLVYVVPERFRSPRFLEALAATQVQLLAVDEAHCISEWGHDFRPDYARLGKFRQRIGNPPTIALTATATEFVRQDIVKQLGLNSPQVFITGFARHNLNYEVQHPGSQRRKDEALVEFLGRTPGSGIVYASTRKRCEELAAQISAETGRPTGAYHAGMQTDDRRNAQDNFMQGRHEIVVATTAFGMGIDKSDVRFVVHYNLPGTLEGYYQEAGRAGRDGQPSKCLLLYSAGDRRIQEFFIESAYPARETVAKVYNFLRNLDQDPIELTQQEIKERLSLPIGSDGVGTCEQLLEKAGVLERLESAENMAIVRLESDLPTLVDLLPRQAKVQRRVLQAVERLVGRRRFELVYFNPRELVSETELEPAALVRTLRELKHLKAFDYIPPFRGRAIHLLDTDKPFEQLEIDFELLERRKAAEYEKLRRVINFAQSTRCRQQEILDYFGELSSPSCGRCDNCGGEARVGNPATTSNERIDGRLKEAVRIAPGGVARARSRLEKYANPAPMSNERIDGRLEEAVRIALSGVARARGRFGKHMIAQMLCGSNSAKITRFGLQRLSTYGLLKPLKKDDVAEFLDALVAAGYLQQVELDPNRPVMLLTDRGREAMSGRIDANLALPPGLGSKLRTMKSSAGATQTATAQQAAETPRPAVATKPPEVAERARPTPVVPAVTEASLPRARPAEVRPRPSQDEAAAAAPVNDTGARASHYWTWRLLAAGFSVDDCVAIRDLDREVVLDHALRAIDSGWQVDARWFLTLEQLSMLEDLIGSEEPQRLRPLLARLPDGLRYEDVQLFLKCRRSAAAAQTACAHPT